MKISHSMKGWFPYLECQKIPSRSNLNFEFKSIWLKLGLCSLKYLAIPYWIHILQSNSILFIKSNLRSRLLRWKVTHALALAPRRCQSYLFTSRVGRWKKLPYPLLQRDVQPQGDVLDKAPLHDERLPASKQALQLTGHIAPLLIWEGQAASGYLEFGDSQEIGPVGNLHAADSKRW